MRRLAPCLAPIVTVLAMAATPLVSDAAEGNPEPEVRAIITAQIDALNAGDAARAESYASPGIKSLFPDPGAFLGMVKQSYAPLIHPRSTQFDATEVSDKGRVQHVTIVDDNGAVWTAVYMLEQVDGHWAISGCVLLKSPETSA